ncbi:MAG: alpha/beta hydrolase [Nitrososphaerales archaeon]|nr:alpha/beta hydrolase [Nitrososphaerales archaeon]
MNGLQMYYEIHGTGQPLFLLHGGAGVAEMFGEVLSLLSKDRQVVAAELQAHGRTADIDRPLRYELMADDIAALIKHLRLGKVDLMGYSLGGGVALRTAIQHPELVRKLALVSTPFRRDGWYPEVLAAMGQNGPESAEALKQTPMYQAYSKAAPRLQDWPVLMTKLGEMLRRDYDWSEEVARIRAPTMIVVGDSDSVRTAHAVEFFELLGGGKKDGRLGWVRDVQRAPMHPARDHTLQHILLSLIGHGCQAVP